MQAIETVKVAAQGKNIRIQTVLNEFAGIVPGDESRLQQVIWNLLNNAIKFTPKGGKVQIFLDRVNSHIELKVVDNGEGISPEMLPQIFERFKQADASTTRQHGGLGLGLSIVKQLVELHGGHVTASSGGKGQGAVFIVNLPVMAVDWRPDVNTVSAANLLKSEAAESNQKLPGVYILAVDDDADARHLIKMLLERAGCVVETASSAQEAMKKVSIFKPHILICDIGMPEEDGYSMIQRLRETDVGRDLPAISLTAYARGEDRIKALRHGFNHHLAKPINPQELIAVLSSLMERYPGSVSDSGPSRN